MPIKIAQEYLRIISPTINFEVDHIKSIPFIFEQEQSISLLSKQNASISKADWDSHESSWDFKKSELLRAKIICRQNSADIDMLPIDEIQGLRKNVPYDARKIDHCIRAYKSDWERHFNQLHSNEEELNRQFIDIYGLQDELTPDVPLDEITILQQGEISIVKAVQSLHWSQSRDSDKIHSAYNPDLH